MEPPDLLENTMLTEATYDATKMAFDQQNGVRQEDEDKRLLVLFSIRPHQNKEKSLLEGRPIYDEREFVTIMVPGDKDTVIDRPATDMDKDRFSRQYAAFKNKNSQEAASGTPLKAMTFLTAGQIKELEFFNCHTVEQLADLADNHAQRFMGIQQLKRMAQDFLRAAKEQAPLTAMRAELDQKDQELSEAKAAINELAERLKILEIKQK